MLRNANETVAPLNGNGNNDDDDNNDSDDSATKSGVTKANVPYVFLSGMFSVARHRWIFGLWLMVVLILNGMSSLVVTSTRPKTVLHYVEAWPPRNLMAGLVDRQNRVAVVVVDDKDDLELVDNFLYSLERQGVFNFCVVPLGRRAHDVLSATYPDHVLPPMPTASVGGSSSDEIDFDEIVTVRPNLLHAFARAGYTLFAADVDSVWRRNAFMEINEIVDLAAVHAPPAFDAFFFFDDSSLADSIVTTDDADHRLSSTQMFLRPTPATLDFLERWVRYRDTLLLGDDRHAFRGLVKDHADEGTAYQHYRRADNDNDDPRDLTSLRLRFDQFKEFRIVVGERARYPSGWMYFDGRKKRHYLSEEQKNAVSIVRNGIAGKNKTRQRRWRLETAGLWRPSGRLPK